MIRGTTPTHTFEIPVSTDSIDKLEILYAQRDEPLFIKKKEDCELSGKSIQVTLSQEDTLKFNCSYMWVQIQLRIKTLDGNVSVSDLIVEDLEKCLFDEAII